MAASLLPFGLCLLLLGKIVRRESGSTTTALAAVAAFSLSGSVVETVQWYSASSFTWALLGCLAAMDGAGRGRPWVTSLAAAAAPAFSAIGLLAGPLGALRGARDGGGNRRSWPCAGRPLLGSAAYLGFASLFRYRDVVAESVPRNVDLRLGLLSTARAPIDVLLPGLFGGPTSTGACRPGSTWRSSASAWSRPWSGHGGAGRGR